MSKAMVARLREKPGGEDIGVTIGDFATTTVEGTFSVAYLVFNTIQNLTTQAEQVACFRNVAAHLEPGGCFVIEVGVPSLRRLPPGETIRAFHLSETRWGIDEFDVANQGLISHHFQIVDGRSRAQLGSLPVRVARGARPDGRASRDEPARALERMEAGAVHEREPQARLGLGEAPRLSRSRSAVLPGPSCTRSSTGSQPSWSTASPEARLSATWRRSRTSKHVAHSKWSRPRSTKAAVCFSPPLSTATLVGTVQVVLALPPNQPHRAEIAKLLVHRSARRRGIAELLMERAEAEARVEGKTLLVLDTVTGDDAERLYERLGWTRVGVIPGYALYPDGRPCDTTVFWKSL